MEGYASLTSEDDVSIMVPDKNGQMQDVVLGFDSIADYINVPSDFGASIGRYANRIKSRGRFVLMAIRSSCHKTITHTSPARRSERLAIPGYEANLIDPITLERLVFHRMEMLISRAM